MSEAERMRPCRSKRPACSSFSDFARAGVVGEETNKLVGYLAGVSRKLDKPLGDYSAPCGRWLTHGCIPVYA